MTNLNFRQAAGILSVASLALAPAAAHAQAFTLNFVPATQTVLPGFSTTFSGTITNTTATALYINGDNVDPLGPGLSTDDTPFYNTFGGNPVLLGAGQTYSLTDLFTVTDTAAAIGTYQGQYTVYGGLDPTASNRSGFQTFSVIVPLAAVPEASTSLSFAVLLAGGAAVWAAKRRKSTAAA